jgi:signal transduction histidine kinase
LSVSRIIRNLEGTKVAWLVYMRWIAGVCVIIATFVSSKLLNISIRATELYILALLLFVLNYIYRILINRINEGKSAIFTEQAIIIVQIIVDLVLLTSLLHFSGGVENPFIIYYIFHLMIASILLPRRIAYMINTFALVLVGLLAFLEFFGIVPHYQLEGFLANGFYHDINYLAGTGFVFVTTSYVVVYMTSAVSSKLRRAEREYRLANIQLEEKDKIKDEYVNRLSHDIKGHVAAIKSCLDASAMLDNPEKIKKFDELALERTEQLSDFIKNLLRITRLRLNKESELTDFSLKEVIEQVIELNRVFATKKQLTIYADLNDNGILFNGNRFSVEEAFTNLIQNAIKYTNTEGKIGIRLHYEQKYFIIEIKDTGIGIPESEKANVFREFYRAQNARKLNREGDGLGLAIVKQIVENHQGKISLKSRENQGSKFTIKLPGSK